MHDIKFSCTIVQEESTQVNTGKHDLTKRNIAPGPIKEVVDLLVLLG